MDEQGLESFRREHEDLKRRIDDLAKAAAADRTEDENSEARDARSVAGQLQTANTVLGLAQIYAQAGSLEEAYSGLHFSEKILGMQWIRFLKPYLEEGQEALERPSKGGKARAAIYETFKNEVRYWWQRWQREPDLYKNKTAFDAAMADKTDMNTRIVAEYRKEIAKE